LNQLNTILKEFLVRLPYLIEVKNKNEGNDVKNAMKKSWQ